MRARALSLALVAVAAGCAAAAALPDAAPRTGWVEYPGGWTAYMPLRSGDSRRVYEYPARLTLAPPGAVPARPDIAPADPR